MDEEFELVATQVLKRTQAMVNKYRRLLMAEGEVGTHTHRKTANEFHFTMSTNPAGSLPPSLQNSSPSSEMVMIDRTFNQEERGNLTQDKRMVLVDPGKNSGDVYLIYHTNELPGLTQSYRLYTYIYKYIVPIYYCNINV